MLRLPERTLAGESRIIAAATYALRLWTLSSCVTLGSFVATSEATAQAIPPFYEGAETDSPPPPTTTTASPSPARTPSIRESIPRLSFGISFVSGYTALAIATDTTNDNVGSLGLSLHLGAAQHDRVWGALVEAQVTIGFGNVEGQSGRLLMASLTPMLDANLGTVLFVRFGVVLGYWVYSEFLGFDRDGFFYGPALRVGFHAGRDSPPDLSERLHRLSVWLEVRSQWSHATMANGTTVSSVFAFTANFGIGYDTY